jgi:hypothetical protein
VLADLSEVSWKFQATTDPARAGQAGCQAAPLSGIKCKQGLLEATHMRQKEFGMSQVHRHVLRMTIMRRCDNAAGAAVYAHLQCSAENIKTFYAAVLGGPTSAEKATGDFRVQKMLSNSLI